VSRSFRDRSAAQRALTLALLAASLAIVALAEHDLQRRPDAEVRGSQLPWRLLSLNAVGATVYLG
jgi:hypothetical protein